MYIYIYIYTYIYVYYYQFTISSLLAGAMDDNNSHETILMITIP